MALLLKKKHIINSRGEEELLNIYTTKTEAVDDGYPCKVVQVEVDGEIITGYIGLTDEIGKDKASSKRILKDGITYAEREFMGIKSMSWYMKNTYPDTYGTMIEIPDDFPKDTSDCTDFSYCFISCEKLTSLPMMDTSKGTNFTDMYYGCNNAISFPQIDTNKGTSLNFMYGWCTHIEILPQLNTSKVIDFRYMYYNCYRVVKVSEIDFSQADNSDLDGIKTSSMFYGCEVLKTIIFNNLPIGTTEETLRTKCSIPETVTEIIMNFRQE